MGKKIIHKKDKVEFYQDKNDKWRWKRIAPNGVEVGASTQGYANKSYCKENAKRNGCNIDDE